jgi:hypothetical protein
LRTGGRQPTSVEPGRAMHESNRKLSYLIRPRR